MPTTLPARIPPVDQTADFLGFLRALSRMYGVLAIAFALIVSIDASCGLFAGRTLAASIVIATGIDLPEADNARVGVLDWPENVAF
jgi:hypothetical protein